MINTLANILGINPALLIIVLVILFLMLAMFLLNGGGIKYPYTGNARLDGEVRELANFKFVKAMGDLYKKIGESRARRKIEGNGIGWVVPVAIIAVVVVLIVTRLFNMSGINFQSEPKLVEREHSCTREDPSLRYLEIGEEIMVGDICDGMVIQPTIIPSTTTPTQTPTLPAPTTHGTTKETETLPVSATSTTPIEQHTIKVVWLDGHIAEQGWMEVPSLDGYHQAGEKTKCKIFDTEALEIPEDATFAFVLFEGGTLISDSLVNLSDTKLNLNQKKVEISLCKPGSWFSLWVK